MKCDTCVDFRREVNSNTYFLNNIIVEEVTLFIERNRIVVLLPIKFLNHINTNNGDVNGLLIIC